MHCGFHCETDEDCGEGLMCYEFTGDLPSQCVPPSMDCSMYCTGDDDCTLPDLCVDGRCVNTCDPDDPLSCPDGYYCDWLTCTSGECVEMPDGPGVGLMGESCSSDLDCEGLRCEEMLGGSACSSSCDFMAQEGCGAGSTCQALGGGNCGYCSCSMGLLGDSCTGNEDCQSNICVHGFCTMLCPETCPSGFNCESIAGYDLCMPGSYGIGQECDAGAECLSGLCTEYRGTDFCSRPCSDDCTCPVGMDCVDSGDGQRCVLDIEEPENSSSGCGCSVVGAPSGSGLALLALAGLILSLLRRRR
jgi:MYXO-CTERM domain-containing protein